MQTNEITIKHEESKTNIILFIVRTLHSIKFKLRA